MTDKQSRLSIVIDSDEARRRIRELEERLRELGQQTDDTSDSTRRLSENNDRLGGSSSRLSKTLGLVTKAAKYGGASLLAFGAMSLKVGGDFEEAMNGVRAVSGAVGEDFENMKDLAKELGSTTAFSATEAANGMEFLAMAGMNTEQIISTIPDALNLAAAGNLDLASSADIMSNIMTGMGLSAEDSARAADVLAAAAAGANVDVGMMGESMKFAAPIAKQLGMNLEETAAMVGVLGNAGIQGSEAGTALRAVYSRFVSDKKALGHFAEMGISIKDANGEMKSMTELVGELAVATKDIDSDGRLAIFKDMAGADAMGALAISVDAMADGSLPNLIGKLEDSEGAAKKMADIRMEGLNGQIKGLKSAFEGLLIGVSETGILNVAAEAIGNLSDVIRNVTSSIPEATESFQTFLQSAEVVTAMDMAVTGLKTAWDGLITIINMAGEAIAPVITFFQEHQQLSESLAIAIGLVGGAFAIYNAAVAIGTAVTGGFVAVLAVLTSPVTLTIAALTALTAAGVYLYRNWDEVKQKAQDLFGSLPDSVQNAGNAIAGIFYGIKDVVESTLNIVFTIFEGTFESFKSIASGALELVLANFNLVFDSIGLVVSTAFDLVVTIVTSAFALVGSAVQTGLEVVKAVLTGDFNAIPQIIGDGLGRAYNIVSDLIGDILGIFVDAGKKLYGIGRDFVMGFINGMTSMVGGALSAAWNMGKNAITSLKDSLQVKSPSRLTTAIGKDTGQGFINGMMERLGVVKSTAATLGKQAIKSLRQSVQTDIKRLQKEIVLFGTDNPLASFEYDVFVGKYSGVDDSEIEHLRELITEKKALVDAENAQKEAIKQRAEAEKRAEEVMAQVKQRAKDYEKAQGTAREGFDNMTKGLRTETPMGAITEERDDRMTALQEAKEMEVISEQEHVDTLLAINQSFLAAKRDLFLTQGQSLFGNLADLAKGFAGEQSGIYKALFAVEKGFAIAQSAIAIQQSVAKAMAVGFPQNIPLIGQAITQGANIMSNIKSVSAGFKTGGYTGNAGVNDVAGVVHGQEYVFDAQATKAIGVNNLEKMRQTGSTSDGGNNINISVSVDASGGTQVSSENATQMSKQLANSIKTLVTETLRKEKRQGGMLYG